MVVDGERLVNRSAAIGCCSEIAHHKASLQLTILFRKHMFRTHGSRSKVPSRSAPCA